MCSESGAEMVGEEFTFMDIIKLESVVSCLSTGRIPMFSLAECYPK